MDRKQSEENAKTAAQIERFKQTARELGCDEDEAAFDEKLKALARHKPSPPSPLTPQQKHNQLSDSTD